MAITRYNLPRLKGKIIAIDGPAGSGKSTTAKLLADAIGYQYLDTGAMYRALTLVALEANVAPSDSQKLSLLATNLKFEFKVITVSFAPNFQVIDHDICRGDGWLNTFLLSLYGLRVLWSRDRRF